MRKKISYLCLCAFFFLFPLTFVKATSKVEFKEVSNGVINTTIHFDEGFVGGIDLSIQLSDNVEIANEKAINFNCQDCTKHYSFDKKNHTLNIIVTSGGIGTKHNLLNKEKQLNVGNITIENTFKETNSYSLKALNLQIIDNTWNSISIENTKDEATTFQYVIKKENTPSTETTNPSESTNSSSSNNSNTDTNTSTNTDTETEESTKSETSSSKKKTTSNNTTKEEEKNESNEETSEESTTTENMPTVEEEEDNSYNATENQKEKNSKKGLYIGVTCTIVAGTCVGFSIYYLVKSKKRKIDF